MTKKILFVCLGNICRSPAAEGIMAHLVEQAGLSHAIFVDSAGIGSWHVGQLPDRRMRSHGAAHGYDFVSRARQICHGDFDKFDIIVAMDEENYSDLMSMTATDDERAKVVRMANYLRHHPDQLTIPDPYYGGDRGFELVIELLEDACATLLDEVRQQIKD